MILPNNYSNSYFSEVRKTQLIDIKQEVFFLQSLNVFYHLPYMLSTHLPAPKKTLKITNQGYHQDFLLSFLLSNVI